MFTVYPLALRNHNKLHGFLLRFLPNIIDGNILFFILSDTQFEFKINIKSKRLVNQLMELPCYKENKCTEANKYINYYNIT